MFNTTLSPPPSDRSLHVIFEKKEEEEESLSESSPDLDEEIEKEKLEKVICTGILKKVEEGEGADPDLIQAVEEISDVRLKYKAVLSLSIAHNEKSSPLADALNEWAEDLSKALELSEKNFDDYFPEEKRPPSFLSSESQRKEKEKGAHFSDLKV